MTDQTSIQSLHNLQQAGQIANQVAGDRAFTDYRQKKSLTTQVRQRSDILLFRQFLTSIKTASGDLYDDPAAWAGVTWGLVKTFVEWQLQQGYAVGSVNVRLSTVKTYAELATKAGYIHADEYSLIRAVSGYSYKEKSRVDQNREADGTPTRVGAKKSEWVELEPEQIHELKTAHAATSQGRRDRLMMCMLFDQGLRCGELAGIEVGGVNLKKRTFKFYRSKTSQTETHAMTDDTYDAMKNYFEYGDAPGAGKLLRKSNKWGKLTSVGMSTRAITRRVNELGLAAGIEGLSAHDARHNWISDAEAGGSSLNVMMQAGGWSSAAMVMRYIKRNKVANQGLKLSRNRQE